MDTLRYWFALLAVVMFPSALLFWLIVHPFIGFWRRRGAPITYSVVAASCVLAAYVIYWFHESILTVDYGTNWWTIGAGILAYVGAAIIETRARKHLKLRILVGMPELVPDPSGSRLLTEGIYGRVRHPRYIAVLLGLAMMAGVANYQAPYVLLPIFAAVLYVIVLFEERELRERFGEAYVRYAERVPRFIPGRGAA